jgi:hypothetical protein
MKTTKTNNDAREAGRKSKSFQQLRESALVANQKLTISGNEMLLIADALKSSFLRDRLVAECLPEEIIDADHYESLGLKWGVNVKDLVVKLGVAPHHLIEAIIGDVREAWKFRKDDFFEFLKSRSYPFTPCQPNIVSATWVAGGQLADESIVVDRIPSHVAAQDVDAVRHALAHVNPHGSEFIEKEVCFPKEIGFTKCVQTNEHDDIVFAQRKSRQGLTRFVRGRKPEPTNKVFVVLKREREHRYVLMTGFVGGRPQPEPWDEKAFYHSTNPTEAKRLSEEFWANHALIFSAEMTVPRTETEVGLSA